MTKSKKYKINYNLAVYNHSTRMYENKDDTYSTFAEARKKQWKCEKCYKMFPNYRTLLNHKIDFHSY